MSNKIGFINHIIMTYYLCIKFNLKITGIILNNKYKYSESYYKLINKNLQFIVEELTGSKVLATIPYIEKPTEKKLQISWKNMRLSRHYNS